MHLGGMVRDIPATPVGSLLIDATGRPTPEFRAELRKIPNLRNAVSVASVWIQALAVIVVAVVISHPLSYVVAFFLIGRTHAQLLALMHESAHRLLFRNKRANDMVGRWLLGYPAFVNTDGYRHVHMAHHREEFGPNEPDIPLYANYPITSRSFWRKMSRDAFGRTGVRLLKQQFSALWRGKSPSRTAQIRIIATQIVFLVVASVMVSPLLYVGLWLGPYLTVWRVMNRLRSIAEHGGLRADDDRRITTHTVRQHLLPTFFFVPFGLGWHLAHHTDPGIPFRSLARYHREMERAGYVTAVIEYPNYRALWRALRTA
jgi:fatty acid desaturase